MTSDDVNGYLKEITGEDFTAKDFRTWAGTVVAARELAELAASKGERHGRKMVVLAIQRVGEVLGNTPTVSRNSYVHPAVTDAYLDGDVIRVAHGGTRRPRFALTREEAALLVLLRRRASVSRAPGRRASRLRRPRAARARGGSPRSRA
ncbi:MAG: hypothetical protein ABJB65_06025 [Chloroflexota bacterium]